MQEYITTILAYFGINTTTDAYEGLPLIAAAIVLFLGVYFFAPKLNLWYQLIRRRRLHWAYQAMVGRRMSKRGKDTAIAEGFYEMLLEKVKKGIITHKDKRRYLRILEISLELEPGTITPKPHVKETKRRIFGRLSVDAANLQAIPRRNRLASIMTGKVK